MKISKKCTVRGKVQGVFFRQGTLDRATELGVTGWVRNLATGEVECLICGEEAQVARLCEWLKQGPPAAKVTDLTIQDVLFEVHERFMIVR